MPNWACGSVSVTGTRENVTSFVNRFIFNDDDEAKRNERRFFARSFTNTTRQAAMEDIADVFGALPQETVGEFSLLIDFAWSAYSCLIQGYPQKFPGETIDSIPLQYIASPSSCGGDS